MTERDLSAAVDACGMLSAWIRDFGHDKEPAFIEHLQLVLDSHAALRARVAELERNRPWADAGQGNDHNNWFWWVVRSGAALRGVDLRNVLCNDWRVRAALYDIMCRLADGEPLADDGEGEG